MVWSRSLPWLVALLLAACGAAPRAPAARPAAGGEAEARPLPGEPVVVELGTDRAQVVRLAEAAAGGGAGQIEIASGVAGAMVAIDGDDPAPLPLTRELGAGPHEVVVTCPDTSTETMTVSVEPGTTVHLRVCSSANQGP